MPYSDSKSEAKMSASIVEYPFLLIKCATIGTKELTKSSSSQDAFARAYVFKIISALFD